MGCFPYIDDVPEVGALDSSPSCHIDYLAGLCDRVGAQTEE